MEELTLIGEINKLLMLSDEALAGKFTCNHMAVFLEEEEYLKFKRLLNEHRGEFVENELLSDYGSDAVNDIMLRDLGRGFFVHKIAATREEPLENVRRRWLEFLKEAVYRE